MRAQTVETLKAWDWHLWSCLRGCDGLQDDSQAFPFPSFICVSIRLRFYHYSCLLAPLSSPLPVLLISCRPLGVRQNDPPFFQYVLLPISRKVLWPIYICSLLYSKSIHFQPFPPFLPRSQEAPIGWLFAGRKGHPWGQWNGWWYPDNIPLLMLYPHEQVEQSCS